MSRKIIWVSLASLAFLTLVAQQTVADESDTEIDYEKVLDEAAEQEKALTFEQVHELIKFLARKYKKANDENYREVFMQTLSRVAQAINFDCRPADYEVLDQFVKASKGEEPVTSYLDRCKFVLEGLCAPKLAARARYEQE